MAEGTHPAIVPGRFQFSLGLARGVIPDTGEFEFTPSANGVLGENGTRSLTMVFDPGVKMVGESEIMLSILLFLGVRITC